MLSTYLLLFLFVCPIDLCTSENLLPKFLMNANDEIMFCFRCMIFIVGEF